MQVEQYNFWKNLNRIRDVLLKDDQAFSSFMDIDYHYFCKCRERLDFLPLQAVFELSEKLNFHFEDLLNNDFDIHPILNRLIGNVALPSRYSVATHSSTRPIMNVLNYIEKTRGEREKINVLRKFQIPMSFLENPNVKTNILLMQDMIGYIKETYNMNCADFYKIGQCTPVAKINSNFKKRLSVLTTAEEIVECFFGEMVVLFDKNYTYKIEKLNSDFVLIDSSPSWEVLEELKKEKTSFGSEDVCQSKMGVISSITWFKFGEFAKVKKIASVYDGDRSNQYVLDLRPFNKLSRSLSSAGLTLH